jgi:hypothetical protein
MKMSAGLACQSRPHKFACAFLLPFLQAMKVFRVLFPPVIGLFCTLMATFIAGCATAPNLPVGKTSQPAAIPAVPPAHNEQPKPPVAEQPRRPAPAPVETSAPIKPEPTPTVATQPPVPKVQYARIVGTQESSILFDNFTAFITAIDGRKIAVGRDGWNVPLEIETGHRTLNVEFNRGVFLAKGRLEFDAVANAHYELKFKTDAEVFGNNSYCNFWVIDTATGKTVSMISKDSVEKIAEASAR